MTNQYLKYQEQAVFTMTPGERILLLYDKAILDMNVAIKYIDQRDFCKSHNNIIQAENIVLYLRGILDMQYPVSKVLFDFYGYIYKNLISANVRKDKELLRELIDMMGDVKGAWQEAETLSHEKPVS
jgi:flagellar secretion chaperone FliS